MSGSHAPKAMIKFPACTWKRVCKSNTSEFILNGLKCSDLCGLADCSNQSDEISFQSEEDEGDIDLLPGIDQSVVFSFRSMSSPTYEISGKPRGSLIVKPRSYWHRS